MNKFFQFFRSLGRFIRDCIQESKAYLQKRFWFRMYGPCILSDFFVNELLPISTSCYNADGFVDPVKRHIASYRPAKKCADAQIKLNDAFIHLPQSTTEKWLKIDDFHIVWCDGAETQSWENRPFSYLGIRLTESLILHESYVPSTVGKNIEDWCRHCDARMLSLDELKLVLLYKTEINNLREEMCDTVLNTVEAEGYWALKKQAGSSKLVIYRENGTCFDGEQNYHCAAVLLLAVKA